MSQGPLQRLAVLAPTLKEAELRVLTYLTAEDERSQHQGVRASSRQIAKACNLARSNVVPALDDLATRGLIAIRQGTATRAAAYMLRFLDVAQMSGPAVGPGIIPGGLVTGPPPDLFQDHPGPGSGPPSTENAALPRATPAVDIDGVLTLEGIIDRLHRASPKTIEPDTLIAARRFLHGYMAKLATDEVRRQGPPHPPDDKIVAQFLAMGDGVGGWPRLQNLLYELMAEKKTPYSYGWFLAVAAQRIHGVSPSALKQRRAELRLVRDRQAVNAATDLQQIHEGLVAAAVGKKMR